MKAGVLIVGSLLWDERDHRRKWRAERLDVSRAVPYSAPIRYGRESGGRDKTFTMVLSRLACRRDYGMGVGVLVLCREELDDIESLLIEAQHLWAAETTTGDGGGRVGAGWGRIGVLFRDRSAPIQGEWGAVARAKGSTELAGTASEGLLVDSNGLLRLGWPDPVGEAELPVDVILATATTPTFVGTRYPTIREVADRWPARRIGEEEYFFRNVQCGIRTFQDARIWSRLAKCERAAAYRQDYPEAVEILTARMSPSA